MARIRRMPDAHRAPAIRGTPMLDFSPARYRTAACLVGSLLLVGGCASDGNMGNTFTGGIQNPFQGPSESGFFALVRKNCASYSIGGQPLGTLIERDSKVKDLTEKLYRGDISNDEYVNMVLQHHPSDDANIPATGCVIDQLTACQSSRCQLTPSKSPELDKAADTVAAEQLATAAETPAAERSAVDSMMENADKESNAGGALGSQP
jgi:hypothetical protein